ncbi:hypothetical protein B7755_038575 [Streptomyces sp. NBS 14/10]|uniref:hypothetical protein n=1 Tax=Streptomyces sp. NBS 14/10 TaxID=1945643 RepID=UPI000B7E50AD|nr:hypothetical protein [Streptomyces sp. NBS 14/10]KAK1186373.1 hypothetical protein B7755_038575 [Streptomyces sp. NBS 14/10]
MEAGLVLRALRTAVFAAVCVLLAALGHALMSGAAVPWWVVGAALPVTCGAAWCLTGRERGPLAVIAATVGAQTALHVAFMLAQDSMAGAGAGAGATPMRMPMPSGHAHHMAHAHDAMASAPLPGGQGYGALGMWSAHLLAALLCGMWLSGGEQAAFRLVRTLAVGLFVPLLTLLYGAPRVPARPRVRPVRHGGPQRLRRLLLAHVIATRGPPPGAAVL